MIRNNGLDILKCVSAIAVIGIHFHINEDTSGKMILAISRFSVPIFFIISGYFFEKQIIENKFKNHLKKIITLTFWASLLYAIPNKGHTDVTLINFLLINDAPYGMHLWYLFSLIYATAVLYFIRKYRKKLMPYLILLLVPAYIIATTNISWHYYLNWIFEAIPFMCIGWIMAKYQYSKISIKTLIILLIFSTIGICFEVKLYDVIGVRSLRGWYICSLVQILSLMVLAIKFKKDSIVALIGRRYSAYIYILHIYVGIAIQKMFDVKNSIFLILLIFFISVFLSAIYVEFIKKRLGKIVLLKSFLP